MAMFTCARMNQIVSANRLKIGISKEVESEAGFLQQVVRNLRSIHADGDRPNTSLVKFIQSLLYAPQLGEARGSPVSAIEH